MIYVDFNYLPLFGLDEDTDADIDFFVCLQLPPYAEIIRFEVQGILPNTHIELKLILYLIPGCIKLLFNLL